MNFGSLTAKILSSGSLLVLSDDAIKGTLEPWQKSLVAIAFSVLSVEAFINELEHDWQDDRDPMLKKKVLTLAKVYSLDSRVVDEFLVLVDARNELVHMHPEEVGLDDVPGGFRLADVVKELERRGVIVLESGTTHTLLSVLRREEVARWANRTARQFIRHAVDALPEGALRTRERDRWSKIGSPDKVVV